VYGGKIMRKNGVRRSNIKKIKRQAIKIKADNRDILKKG
jgi:hypothetical protein